MRLKASSQTPAGLNCLLTDGDTKEALRLAQEHKVGLASFLRAANLRDTAVLGDRHFLIRMMKELPAILEPRTSANIVS